MIPGLIIDSFAGGGGASTGIEMALGRSPDIAINHNEVALAIHAANHPTTHHMSKNIWHVDPLDAVGKRHVSLAWFSPDCKHFSKAKGGAPVKRNIRDLAWVVVMWAQRVRPDVICLENVEEFQTWGPVGLDNRPIRECAGETFRDWVAALKRAGYKVQFRELRACDYGAPTIRKRFFMVARCDGKPIVWPAPTHGDPASEAVRSDRLEPWRTAADIIDWFIPCPSIFLTTEEGKALGIKRPLAPATMARIAKGVQRYVIEAERPFLANLTHQGGDRTEGLDEPFRTVTGAHRGEKALIVPHITKFRTGTTGAAIDTPLPTVTANSFIKRPAGAPPLGVVAAFLAQHNNDRSGPKAGREASAPVSTVTASGAQQGVVAAHMLNLKGSDRRAESISNPVNTICGGGTHIAQVSAFLTKYYGTGGQLAGADEPAHTVTAKARLGLVTVEIGGEPYVIADIGMRMLTPRELFRAQGFPDSYIIDRGLFTDADGRQVWRPVTKSAQISACGNSVCPPLAAALIRAQFPEAATTAAESEAA